tara:strand:+ start:2068 stop:2901 length:834 start_codon:yes stop_codon:yes gene_type:complete
MLGRITREAEKLTINGSGIEGVQSVSASYTSQAQFLNNLGVNEIKYAPQGPQQATLEVNTLLTQLLPDGYGFDSRDPMQNYTGDLAFSGAVNHGSKVFQFTEGYLQSYSVSCGIGQIPQATSSSLIYGEFGTGVLDSYEQESQITPQLNVTSFSSMEINLDTFKTNRVLNFNVNIATPRLPIYAIGTDVPTGVIAGSPLEVNVNFEIQPDDYEIKNMRFVPEETVFENTVITLKKNNSNDILLTYSFENMLLSSESFQGGVDSNASVNFSLRSFILR